MSCVGACSSWEGSVAPDWRRGRLSIARLTITLRLEMGAAAVRCTPTTPTVRTGLARRGEPGGSHSSSLTTLNTEHSRVIASEIAPDIHTLSILWFYLPGFVPVMPANCHFLHATMLPEPSVACAGQQRQNSSPLFRTLIPIAAPGMSQIVLMTFPTRFDADHLVPAIELTE